MNISRIAATVVCASLVMPLATVPAAAQANCIDFTLVSEEANGFYYEIRNGCSQPVYVHWRATEPGRSYNAQRYMSGNDSATIFNHFVQIPSYQVSWDNY